ncbi:MAG: hypothetical protein ACE3JQ_00200 [Paenisporosarcina sp.]
MQRKKKTYEDLIATLFAENTKLKAYQDSLIKILVQKGLVNVEELNNKYRENIKKVDPQKIFKDIYGVTDEEFEGIEREKQEADN